MHARVILHITVILKFDKKFIRRSQIVLPILNDFTDWRFKKTWLHM